MPLPLPPSPSMAWGRGLFAWKAQPLVKGETPESRLPPCLAVSLLLWLPAPQPRRPAWTLRRLLWGRKSGWTMLPLANVQTLARGGMAPSPVQRPESPLTFSADKVIAMEGKLRNVEAAFTYAISHGMFYAVRLAAQNLSDALLGQFLRAVSLLRDEVTGFIADGLERQTDLYNEALQASAQSTERRLASTEEATRLGLKSLAGRLSVIKGPGGASLPEVCSNHPSQRPTTEEAPCMSLAQLLSGSREISDALCSVEPRLAKVEQLMGARRSNPALRTCAGNPQQL